MVFSRENFDCSLDHVLVLGSLTLLASEQVYEHVFLVHFWLAVQNLGLADWLRHVAPKRAGPSSLRQRAIVGIGGAARRDPVGRDIGVIVTPSVRVVE
jgi:hypothetical protein